MRVIAILLAVPTTAVMCLGAAMAYSLAFLLGAGRGVIACALVYFGVMVVVEASLLWLALRPKKRFLLCVPGIGLAPLWAVFALMSTSLDATLSRADMCESLLVFNVALTVFYLGALLVWQVVRAWREPYRDVPPHLVRWYHLTPDRVVLGLLAIGGLLRLSDWLGWFGFNERPGWAVLIAVATVAAGVLFLFLWFAADVLFRWRFQFSLRSLLLFAVVVAIPCSWLETEMQRAKKQKEAVEAIKKEGEGVPVFGWGTMRQTWKLPGMVRYDYELAPNAKEPASNWLRTLLGKDFFAHVIMAANITETDCLEGLPHLQCLGLSGPKIDDVGLRRACNLKKLKILSVSGTKVTDAGLEYLKRLPELEGFLLQETAITDLGLRTVKDLPRLRGFGIEGAKITDRGLEELQSMPQLQNLSVADNKITDAGLAHLKGLRQLVGLDLSNTRITDAGLERLEGMTSLQALILSGTKVTDAGLRRLPALPQLKDLELGHTGISDAGLVYLDRLPKLENLSFEGVNLTDTAIERLASMRHLGIVILRGTHVTAAGVKKLRQALPKCAILPP